MKIIILTLVFGLLGYTTSKPLESNDATDALVEHRSSDSNLMDDDHTLSYYGGLKGHVVQFKDSKVHKITVKGKDTQSSAATVRQGPIAAASSSIALTAHDDREHLSTFEEDFNKIQTAAARLVAIQELAKRKGTFSSEDNRVYAASLLELGQAAQNLAMLQQTGQIQDFSVLLQPFASADNPQKSPGTSDKNDGVTIEAAVIDEQKVNEVTEQQLTGDDLLPPNNEDPYEDVHDSVAVTSPKKDASVAEAKPVGVSIAGKGGVASSKPNAIALSGINGLAVSAPKATAIAGVNADEAAAFGISLPSRSQLVIKSASTRLPASSYDDYDYIDTLPVQANTRNVPLLRSADANKSKMSNSKPKPMMATVNAADAIVQMWRTAIAEDYAAPSAAFERNNDFDIEQFYKFSKQLNKQRRV